MLIETYKRDRLKTKTKRGSVRNPNTLNRELQLLSRVYSMATDNGLAEFNGLRWDEVDFSRNIIRVRRTKSGNDRYLPMNSVVRNVLLERRVESPGRSTSSEARRARRSTHQRRP